MLETTVQTDFSGGVTGRRPASDFSERQLADAKGLILESESELRSQWRVDLLDYFPASGPIFDVGVVDGTVVYMRGDDVVYAPAPPADGGYPDVPATFLTNAGSPRLRITGEAAIRPDDPALGTGWRNCLVLNDRDRTLAAAGGDGAMLAFTSAGVAASTPADFDGSSPDFTTAGEQNAIPPANVAAMWGDYLVLGDILWASDDTKAFSASNAAAFPHGLWFSRPGETARYEQINVEFMGQSAGNDNRIVGLFPVDSGAVVLTTSLVVALSGTPTSHDYRELRRGISPQSSQAATWWPSAGVVVWVDDAGRVWHTDGDDVGRLDEALPDASSDDDAAVGSWGPYLVVHRGGRWWCMRLLESGAEGAWTELSLPYTPSTSIVSAEAGLWFGCEAGLARLAPDWGPRGEVTGLQFPDGGVEGPHVDTGPVEQLLQTRTLSARPHRQTWWHSFGLQASGGSVTEAYWLAEHGDVAPWQADDGETVMPARGEYVWPCGGPSVEGAARWLLSGDVSIESWTVWFHGGRDER